MKLFYVEWGGRCAIFAAKTASGAQRELRDEYGRDAMEMLRDVRPATSEDIGWITAMGGYVPKVEDVMPGESLR